VNYLLKSVNLKPDGWLWYFPQYHIVIFILVLFAIAMLILTVVLLTIIVCRVINNSAKLDLVLGCLTLTECPCCHRKSVRTIQQCTSPDCREIQVLKDRLELLPVAQHAHGD